MASPVHVWLGQAQLSPASSGGCVSAICPSVYTLFPFSAPSLGCSSMCHSRVLEGGTGALRRHQAGAQQEWQLGSMRGPGCRVPQACSAGCGVWLPQDSAPEHSSQGVWGAVGISMSSGSGRQQDTAWGPVEQHHSLWGG